MRGESVNRPVFARFWLWMSPGLERGGLARHRDALLAGLSGRVIEVGAGNGLNFGHYPPAVTQVIAVEPNPHLRRVAYDAAARAPVPVEVTDAVAERLPAADADFDAAVASLVLCSVPDTRLPTPSSPHILGRAARPPRLVPLPDGGLNGPVPLPAGDIPDSLEPGTRACGPEGA
jgi:SAM-dependent methyltransferase